MEPSFAIVAEPNRRAILRLLLSSERSVGEIERELRLSQPSVSKHLRVLREAGFVESRIVAQRHLYRLSGRPIGRIAGPGAMELGGWQRLNAEYAKRFGVETPGWPPSAPKP